MKHNFYPGTKVTYSNGYKTERGIVKALSGEGHVFVVYHCAEDWDNYRNYTAARTHIENLKMGWREK